MKKINSLKISYTLFFSLIAMAMLAQNMDLLGFEKIEKVLTDPNYLLYDEEHGGGLWVGKRYAKTGRRYPEPIMILNPFA